MNVPECREAGFAEASALGAPPAVAESPWVVLKFGGSSVSSLECWNTIAGVLRNRLRDGLRPVVVCSALQGVTNLLSRALEEAVTGGSNDALRELRDKHARLAGDLQVAEDCDLEPWFQELEQLLAGVRLVREASPRVRARVLSAGELLSTRLGTAFLNRVGIETAWQDARCLLRAVNRPGRSAARLYLAASCDYAPDAELRARLSTEARVVLTQGFIAGNDNGETVLLGRGGSDTSAGYFGAILQARRVEIWSDVPGMYTADPHTVPSARLLLELHYDEAQELAAMGSKALHPRCLPPFRAGSIPLFMRCTMAPHISGTVISAATTSSEPQLKGISTRSGTVLVSLEGSVMWQEVGFLAAAFACFRDHNVSVDLVSTSETNVTVTIDTGDELFSAEVRDALLRDLEALCRVRLIEGCAIVSLVGRKIRRILPELAPAFEVFGEEKILMVTQASNDLNFSFVIEQKQLEKLVTRLHASMIGRAGGSPAYGPSWEELFRAQRAPAPATAAWWQSKRERLLEIAAERVNAYVYDTDTIRESAAALKRMRSVDRVLYAMKANFNRQVLRILAEEGIDFDCVSPGEVRHLRETVPQLDDRRILFTPNFAPRAEYEWALSEGLQVTLDNLHPLREWPELFRNQKLFIRLDPGKGRGHHAHVKTAGTHSKFGIPRFEIDELAKLVERAGAEVIGIHAHSGSGILDPENWRSVAGQLIKVARRFPGVKALDLGGGLGVPERAGDRPFDLEHLDEALGQIREACPEYELWLEPGRYLVATAGVLVTRVTQLKGKGDLQYIGVATGMNSLIRPALYGAHHEIFNLSRLDEPATRTATVVGPICETGDRLGSDRMLPPTREGDVLVVTNAGAYGYVMSSHYNLRDIAAEIVI